MVALRISLLACLYPLFVTGVAYSALARIDDDPWWSAEVEAALKRAGERRGEWESALQRVPEAQREGLAFLLEHMPGTDLVDLAVERVLEEMELAYRAFERAPWRERVPKEIFLNDVLPYVNVSEARDPWRREFFEKFGPLVEECETPGEAAHVLNQKVFPLVEVRYSTQRKRADQSPKESMEIGMASCTGLSILLVDACRAVGVPARLAGIPRWANKNGNHTWVEIWDGDWHFAGAAEPDGRGLDHAWFTGDAALALRDSKWNAIYAVSYARTDTEFPMVWARGAPRASAVNVTDRYVPRDGEGRVKDRTRLMVRVLGGDGERVAAVVSVTDTAERSRVFEGTSRDESFDLNDLLTFEVPHQRTYRVAASAGERRAEVEVAVAEANQEIVTLRLESQTGETGAGTSPGSEAGSQTPAKEGGAAGEAETLLAEELARWFAATPDERDEHEFDPAATQLLHAEPARVRHLAWDAYREAPIHAERRADFEAQRVRSGGHESPYVVREVGEKPAGGWPLFIAMHGGGGVPKQVNDSQWRHMQRYYKDQDSVDGYLYLALRAPTDAWNGFYTDYVYPLVADLVRQFLLFGEVDPDRVFLMGYSHGGYGAFAIGPKMPDRFAAVHASAAAPTGGETSAVNLRNLPFTFMIGENDRAYGRIDRCRAFAEAVQKLRGDRQDIYPVTMEYQPGYGHGGLPDRDKIAPMYPARRNPVPRDLSWELTDGVIHDFYWLSAVEPDKGKAIEARCADNVIELIPRNLDTLLLHLDDRLVDFARPVTVRAGERQWVLESAPELDALCDSLLRRGDPGLAWTVEVRLDLAAPEKTDR